MPPAGDVPGKFSTFMINSQMRSLCIVWLNKGVGFLYIVEREVGWMTLEWNFSRGAVASCSYQSGGSCGWYFLYLNSARGRSCRTQLGLRHSWPWPFSCPQYTFTCDFICLQQSWEFKASLECMTEQAQCQITCQLRQEVSHGPTPTGSYRWSVSAERGIVSWGTNSHSLCHPMWSVLDT